MNVVFCTRVADAVEASKTYEQSIFVGRRMRGHRWCKTPACIAGHAAFLLDGTAAFEESYAIDVRAREAMGLSKSQARELFQPYPLPIGEHPDGRQAAEVIRYMVQTGEVDWERVR